MPEVPKCWSVNNCFRWNLSQPWYIIHQHADLPPTFITLCTHVGTGRVPSYKRCVFTLQSILHSRPSWTMRSPGACRKCGRKWRSWMLSFSSPLSLDLDLGLTDRRKQTFYYFEFICISKRWNFNKNLGFIFFMKNTFCEGISTNPSFKRYFVWTELHSLHWLNVKLFTRKQFLYNEAWRHGNIKTAISSWSVNSFSTFLTDSTQVLTYCPFNIL